MRKKDSVRDSTAMTTELYKQQEEEKAAKPLEDRAGPQFLVHSVKNSGGRSTRQHRNRSLTSDSHCKTRNGLDGNVDREETKAWAGAQGRRTKEMDGAAPEHSPTAAV